MPQLDFDNRRFYERLYGEKAPNLYGEGELDEFGREIAEERGTDPAIIEDTDAELEGVMGSLQGNDESQNARQLMRDMGRASTTIGSAFAGSKPDYSFYDTLDKRDSEGATNKKRLASYLLQKYGYDNAAKRLQLRARGLNEGKTNQDLAQERLDLSRERLGFQREKEGLKRDDSVRKRTIPGHGVALDEVSARKIREKNTDLENGIGAAQKLQAFIGQKDQYLSDPKKALATRAEAAQYVAELKSALRIELTGGGNISTAEHKLMDQIVTNPMAIFSLDTTSQAALKTLGERFQSRRQNLMQTQGVLPVKPDGVSEQKWNSLTPDQQKKVFDEFRKRNPSSEEEAPAEAQEAPPEQWSEIRVGDDGRQYTQDVQSGQWWGRDNEQSEWTPWQ